MNFDNLNQIDRFNNDELFLKPKRRDEFIPKNNRTDDEDKSNVKIILYHFQSESMLFNQF